MIRSIRYITLLVLLQFVTGISVLYAQSITSASGIVRDSVSGEPLSYVSVMFENSTIGAMTDDDGAFSLQNDKGLTRLVVSSLGYDNKVVNLKAGQKNDNLDILLSPTSFQIAEVEVRPTKERYSRKDNPAVELIKKVIEHKNDNRIEAKDEYQSEVYEKLSMSLDDFNVTLEVDNIATIKDLIRRDFGVSVLAKSACMDELKKKKIVVLPIENLSMMREINIVYTQDFEHFQLLRDIVRYYNETRQAGAVPLRG